MIIITTKIIVRIIWSGTIILIVYFQLRTPISGYQTPIILKDNSLFKNIWQQDVMKIGKLFQQMS